MNKLPLKHLRKMHSLSQSDIARLFQISQQAVAKWEAGLSMPEPQLLVRLAEYFHVSVDYLLGRKNNFLSQITPCGHFNQIPVLGTVKAGYGREAFEDHQGSEYAEVRDPENCFYLTVKGDSMEPYIREGDIALIRRQSTLQNGELGVIVYGNSEGTLKQFYSEGSRVLLKPFNPAHETLVFSGPELSDLFIIGKVLETKTRW